MNKITYTKNCKICNAQIHKNSAVCNQCGAKQGFLTFAKLTPCRKCNAQISSDATKCPHCGTSSTTMIIVYALIAFILLITVFFMFKIIFDTDFTSVNENTNTYNNTQISSEESLSSVNVLYEDDNYKISYIDFVDPNLGVTAFNLILKIENKTDKKIVAMLKDGYANDTAITFMTGLPITIEPQKNAVGTFSFGYNYLGFDSIYDIDKLEFKFCALDEENYDTIYETDTIKIEY